MDLTTIQTDLGYAKLYYLQELDAILAQMKRGCGDTKSITLLRRVIKALEWRVDASINDSVTSALYACMMQIIGSFNKPYAIDPTVMIPNTTIIVEGSVGLDLTYTEADLIDADPPNGNWYLPLIDEDGNAYPSTYRPSLVTINGASITATYDSNFTPTRLYGFQDNTVSQDIIVTIVKT